MPTKGHEGHLQFRDSARDLECAFVEVERLLRAAELDVPVPEESEPTYERRGVAVRLGDLDGLSEIHDCGVRVALEERDQSEFATRAICPSGFIEFLGERKCLRPGALRQRWVEVLVGLALDDQNSKPKPLVVLDQWIVKVIAQAFGDFGNGERGKLTAQAAHFRVESVPLVAACDECFARLGVERLRASPDAKPSESVGFGDELMRVRGLRDEREGTVRPRATYRRCRPSENGRTS